MNYKIGDFVRIPYEDNVLAVIVSFGMWNGNSAHGNNEWFTSFAHSEILKDPNNILVEYIDSHKGWGKDHNGYSLVKHFSNYTGRFYFYNEKSLVLDKSSKYINWINKKKIVLKNTGFKKKELINGLRSSETATREFIIDIIEQQLLNKT